MGQKAEQDNPKRKTDRTTDLVVVTDGASKNNQNQEDRRGALGYIVEENNECVQEHSELLGQDPEWTSNRAEYQAAIEALNWVLSNYDPTSCSVRLLSDSEFMIKQIEGEYNVNTPGIKPYFREVTALIEEFDQFELEHRSEEPGNRIERADELAGLAFDD
ncbi:ribonuclease HI family protein [Natronorubrum bangense]|uniref:Ribonuclease H I n=2 Tax=Natronorubrum bangense TaxID=61858 RepID=L9WJZ2_9EURY|nr:ribonuclease HI family protein [Natronorubrum bangense]ELY49712.1 ribonuclease H I [Natronorubrum bangense JCM 10635]QCC55344.1 hypothetical protein DV706_13250 [Natronorubrum bangense]